MNTRANAQFSHRAPNVSPHHPSPMRQAGAAAC